MIHESPEEMWIWMMSWCKHKGLPPADENVWKMAEKEYVNYQVLRYDM